MISAPAIGCSCSSFISSASAGGQLEHPSEVNNSTSMGVRVWLEPVWAADGSEKAAKRRAKDPIRKALDRAEWDESRVMAFNLEHETQSSHRGYRPETGSP
jgi:hypothetical protein